MLSEIFWDLLNYCTLLEPRPPKNFSSTPSYSTAPGTRIFASQPFHLLLPSSTSTKESVLSLPALFRVTPTGPFFVLSSFGGRSLFSPCSLDSNTHVRHRKANPFRTLAAPVCTGLATWETAGLPFFTFFHRSRRGVVIIHFRTGSGEKTRELAAEHSHPLLTDLTVKWKRVCLC